MTVRARSPLPLPDSIKSGGFLGFRGDPDHASFLCHHWTTILKSRVIRGALYSFITARSSILVVLVNICRKNMPVGVEDEIVSLSEVEHVPDHGCIVPVSYLGLGTLFSFCDPS